MAVQPLPISRLIKISVALTPTAVQAESQQNMLILGNSPVIDVKQRFRVYDTLAEVANDFASNDPEYLAAIAWFSQIPQPNGNLLIGRWAQTAQAGLLVGAPFTATQQSTLLAALILIAAGSFTVSLDGVAKNITALNFTADTTLPGVAATIQTALNTAVPGTTCVWNAAQGYFEIQSATTGVLSAVSFLTPEGTGTDISGTLGMTAASSGAYVVAGIAAETALAAVTLFDINYGTAWYGLFVCGAADADHQAISPYIEGANNYHYYGVNTQEAGVLSSVSTTDIAYILKQGGFKRTAVHYSSTSLYAVVSMLARIMTTNYTQNNSVITLMYKNEPTIIPELLIGSQVDALEAKNANVFVTYNFNNGQAIIEPGISCAGIPWFIDTTMGIDALVLGVQTALLNALFSTPTKVPQTDSGMHLLATAIEAECIQFANDGLLGPGTWTGQNIGSLNNGDYMPKGYYVYAPPVASQPLSDRASRISVPFQVAVKLQGAVHTVDVSITVND